MGHRRVYSGVATFAASSGGRGPAGVAMTAERMAWAVGGLGLAVAVFGALLQPDAFAFAWLSALTVWLRWPLGCLALILVHALTGGRWGMPIRPWLLLGIGALPLLLPAIIPVLLLA